MAWTLLAAVAVASCRGEKAAPPAAATGDAAKLVIKPPNVAGAFYPGQRDALAAAVEGYIGAAEQKVPAAIVVAVFTPHAGYQFSGGVAGVAYRQLQGREPATVVLLGPSHYCSTPEIAAPTFDGFETPLGVAPVDTAFVAAVAERCEDVRFTNVPFAKEHSLETQLPFVQTLFPEARVAPFIFCEHGAGAAERFARALSAVIKERRGDTLIITTCDLSHYYPYDKAVKLDRAYIAAFKKFDAAAIFAGERDGAFEIDAPGPVAATLWAGRELGATDAVALEFKNSGDVTGDSSRGVVGYFAGALVKHETLPRAK